MIVYFLDVYVTPLGNYYTNPYQEIPSWKQFLQELILMNGTMREGLQSTVVPVEMDTARLLPFRLLSDSHNHAVFLTLAYILYNDFAIESKATHISQLSDIVPFEDCRAQVLGALHFWRLRSRKEI